MADRIIENVPRVAQFLDGGSMLTPFVGSLWAALTAMGKPRPYADILAMSGTGTDAPGMEWWYVHSEGMDTAGFDVVDFEGGLYAAAISIDEHTVGRKIHEGDVLYVNIPEKHARIVELELKPKLAEDEREVLENFLETKLTKEPFRGR